LGETGVREPFDSENIVEELIAMGLSFGVELMMVPQVQGGPPAMRTDRRLDYQLGSGAADSLVEREKALEPSTSSLEATIS
jgi:hypothetical protein